ncbi:hypothetical protein ACFCW7_10875 [Paenibacillus glucanolyticus]|uniref:hypothetical protein n=1 Tax=Paenibacillus glucanolyticus TaxID=59843 RepID=UPI0035E23850
MVHYSPPDGVELAKLYLQQILSNQPRTLNEIYAYCKAQYPIKKSAIKEARKELGVISYEENGVRLWRLPSPEQEDCRV